MSTFSCSAISCALRSGRTLKPMMIAFDAEASSTSVSVIAPTPERNSLSRTFSFESLVSKSVITSTEPCTSPLRMTFSSFVPAALICSASPSSDTRELLASAASRDFLLAIFGNAARLVAIGHHHKLIASLRQRFHADNFHRSGRRSGLQLCAAIVKHRAHFAVNVADHKIVARVQSSVLHQHGGHRTASAIELGFEHYASRSALGSSLQFAQIGDQANHFHQQIQIRFLLRRNVDEHRLAAPLFRHQAAIGKLFLDAVGQGVRLVDLVHRDNDGNFRGVRVVDGFNRLRHHAVVGGNHQAQQCPSLLRRATACG